jgi:putative heme iron utilization protein
MLRSCGLVRKIVSLPDYEHATPDPLADTAPGFLAHVNTDHVDAMVLLAKSQAGIEAIEATITSIDRLGFTLRLKSSDGVKGTRINFPREITTPQDTRAVLVEMVKQAR